MSFYAVKVVYQNQTNPNDSFTYKVHKNCVSEQLEVGSLVLVPVLQDNYFKVATVVRVMENPILDPDINYRWVAQKLDVSNYNKFISGS